MSEILALLEFRTRALYVRRGLSPPLHRQTEICMLATEQVFLTAGVTSHVLLSKPAQAESWLWFEVLNQMGTRFRSQYDRIWQLCVDTHNGVGVMARRFGVPYSVMVEIIDASRAKESVRGAAMHDVVTRIEIIGPDVLKSIEELIHAFTENASASGNSMSKAIGEFNKEYIHQVNKIAIDVGFTDEFVHQIVTAIGICLLPEYSQEISHEPELVTSLSFRYWHRDIRNHIVDVLIDEHNLPKSALYRAAGEDDAYDIVGSEFDLNYLPVGS